MQNIFFTPGPAQIYPTVPTHIHKFMSTGLASISHRSSQYKEIHKHAVEQLQKAFDLPEECTVFFGGSATQFWQTLTQNLVENTSFHLVNGVFSKNFYDTVKQLGKSPVKYEVALGQGFDMDSIVVPDEAEIITLAVNETSTGVYTDPAKVYKLKQKYPTKLLLLDVVSVFPYCDFNWDFVDGFYFSVQKGMGLPAGLGVCVVNQKCIDKANSLNEKGISTGSYNSFVKIYKKAREYQTNETPNVMGIYLLGKVLEDMNTIGMKKIRDLTDQKAKLLYDFVDKSTQFTAFVEPKWRSPTVATINCPNPKQVIEKLKEKKIIIGSGYGDLKETQVRIALFPATSVADVEMLIAELGNI
jgi:phosphoserine aminotransferase